MAGRLDSTRHVFSRFALIAGETPALQSLRVGFIPNYLLALSSCLLLTISAISARRRRASRSTSLASRNFRPRLVSKDYLAPVSKIEEQPMTETIRKLAATSIFFAFGSTTCFFIGSRYETPVRASDNPLADQFFGDPGDGWMLMGLLLIIITVAIATAGLMLWNQEKN
jgi:hypothetical protein